jgi:hypothetical protein
VRNGREEERQGDRTRSRGSRNRKEKLMSEVETLTVERPLTETERKLLVAAKLFQKKHRHGATWKWLRDQCGLPGPEMKKTMLDLRRRRLVVFKKGVKHSTFVTKKGVELALGRGTDGDGSR